MSRLRALMPGIRHHHERYDGKGYPDGLKGDEVHLVARIISVADTYDAMTTSRVYRSGLPKEVAFEEIKKGSGTQYGIRYKINLSLLQTTDDKVSTHNHILDKLIPWIHLRKSHLDITV